MTKEKYRNNLKVELAKIRKNQLWLSEQLKWSYKHVNQIANEKAGTTTAGWKQIANILDVSIEDLLD